MPIVRALLLMLILGAVLGSVLGYASKRFHVEADHRVDDVFAMLPGYNCGGCGNPGCSGMAEKLVSGECTIAQCKPCKPEQRVMIQEYLDAHKEAA